jgi:hypothetical protein
MIDDGRPQGQGTTRTRADRRRVRLLILFAAAMIGFAFAPFLNGVTHRSNKDYTLWYYVGRAVAGGESVYPQDGRQFPFMYPPSCAAMFAVASVAGELPFIGLLIAANSAAWAAAVLLSVRLATGKARGRSPWLYLVPSLGVAAYVHDTYLLGQPNLVLLACMMGAGACLRGRRPIAAGGLVAIAAAIKAFPFMGIAYFIYRGMWKATAAMVVALTLAVVVAPMPFRGISGAYSDLGTWTMGMVLRYDSDGIAQRPGRGFGYKNQSLMALANRLLRPIAADGESRDGWRVNVASLDFAAINRVILLTALGLGGLYVAVMPWRRREDGPTAAIEWAMLVLLILMFSPLSFNYFYVWLLYPLTLALHLGMEAPRRSAGRAVLIGSVATSLGLLALSIPFRREAAAYGNSFFAAFILLVALGWRMAIEPTDAPIRVLPRLILARLRRSRPAPPAPHMAPGRPARRRRPSPDRARRGGRRA